MSKIGRAYFHWMLYHNLPASIKTKIRDSDYTENYTLQRVHTVAPGGSFGEIALQSDARRAARVVTVTDCHLAIVRKEDYNKCLKKFALKI